MERLHDTGQKTSTDRIIWPGYYQIGWAQLTAGKQAFTLADTLHPALPQCIAGGAYMVDGADQVSERVFEVLRQVQPVPRIHIQLEALQDVR